MKVYGIAAATLLATAVAGQQPAANGSGQPPDAPASQPRRVHAKISGFDLAPQSASPNQTGGASRGTHPGNGGEPALLLAPHKAKIYSLHPTFWWTGSPGGSYTFELVDLASQTTYRADVKGTEFAYPEDAPALEPGKTYRWRVGIAGATPGEGLGSPSAPALIVLLGGDDRQQVESALATVPAASPDADAAKARVLYDNRLWFDALAAYSALVAAHPGNEDYLRMRATLYDQVPAAAKLADADYAQLH